MLSETLIVLQSFYVFYVSGVADLAVVADLAEVARVVEDLDRTETQKVEEMVVLVVEEGEVVVAGVAFHVVGSVDPMVTTRNVLLVVLEAEEDSGAVVAPEEMMNLPEVLVAAEDVVAEVAPVMEKALDFVSMITVNDIIINFGQHFCVLQVTNVRVS